MDRSQPTPTRQRWLLIFGALVFSVLLYVLLCYVMEHGTPPRRIDPIAVTQMRPFVVGWCVAMLIISVAWLRFRVDGKIGGEGRAVALSP